MDENKDLKKFLDEKFQRVHKRLAGHDEQFSDIRSIFLKFFDKLEFLIETKADKKDVEKIYNLLDAQNKKLDTYMQESIFLNHQVNRHESWIHKIAEKIGIKLKYF